MCIIEEHRSFKLGNLDGGIGGSEGDEGGREQEENESADEKQSSLARLAYSHYSKEYLWRCTLVSTWEPCAMCSGTSSLPRPLLFPPIFLFLSDL
jgi:hypothetical protein